MKPIDEITHLHEEYTETMKQWQEMKTQTWALLNAHGIVEVDKEKPHRLDVSICGITAFCQFDYGISDSVMSFGYVTYEDGEKKETTHSVGEVDEHGMYSDELISSGVEISHVNFPKNVVAPMLLEIIRSYDKQLHGTFFPAE